MIRTYAIAAGALRRIPLDLTRGVSAEARWIDLVQPTDEEEKALERALGIDIPTRAEAGGIQASDRLAAADGTLYLSALVPAGPDATPPTVPVTFILAGERLITVRYSAVEALDPLIRRWESGQARLAGSADLFAALLEHVVDRIAEQLERIGESLEQIGRGVFLGPAAPARRTGRRVPIHRRIRRLEAGIEDIGHAHGISADLRECLQSLVRLVAFAREHSDDGLRRRLKAIEVDLHAVAEHNAYLAADMEFMLDATVGLIDIQQNKVIYILSIVGIAITPPVLVASTYGMNFKLMPELGWAWGYPYALALMLLSAVLPFLFFKWRGWL